MRTPPVHHGLRPERTAPPSSPSRVRSGRFRRAFRRRAPRKRAGGAEANRASKRLQAGTTGQQALARTRATPWIASVAYERAVCARRASVAERRRWSRSVAGCSRGSRSPSSALYRMQATPDTPRRASALRPQPVPAAGSPFSGSSSSTPPPRHSSAASRRALARAPGTPVDRIRREEAWRPAAPSPRRIRQRSWSTRCVPRQVHPTRPLTALTRVCSARYRLRDGPSNALLALETRLADLSFDSAGYPLGIALNALHLLVRLPSFYAALPALSELWPGASAATGTDASSVQAASRYARRMATADARLEALQRQAAHSGAQGWIRWTAWISFALVLLSVANAAYLATRRRQYQMVLRRVSPPDPFQDAANEVMLIALLVGRTRSRRPTQDRRCSPSRRTVRLAALRRSSGQRRPNSPVGPGRRSPTPSLFRSSTSGYPIAPSGP